MSFSILGAVKTCTLDTAYADKIQSDRFFNPNNMVCPTWLGVDNLGREVCPDSFNTKSGGCNSALDRVNIENDVSRPYYFEYITLSTPGLRNDIYSGNAKASTIHSANANAEMYASKNGCNGSGGYGIWNNAVSGSTVGKCSVGYSESMPCCSQRSSSNSPYANISVSDSCASDAQSSAKYNYDNRHAQYANMAMHMKQKKSHSGF
jgi:hypothetical protein